MNSIARINALIQKGEAFCPATIVKTHGSTPGGIGAKMIVCADGTPYGSVGGGCGERQVSSAALRCLLSDEKPGSWKSASRMIRASRREMCAVAGCGYLSSRHEK